MLKQVKKLFAKWKYPKLLARVRYRIFLWDLYNGTVKTPLIYTAYSVRVNLTSSEIFVRIFNQIYSIQTVFNSTPSGKFISDESFSRIQLDEEDKIKGFKNPFEKEEQEELDTLGRILSFEERRHKKLIRLMDSCELEKFGY